MQNRTAVCCAAFVLLLGAAEAGRLSYPQTRVVAVRDSYFGRTVADPYRWLEDSKNPEVVAWAAAQTKVATAFFREPAVVCKLR